MIDGYTWLKERLALFENTIFIVLIQYVTKIFFFPQRSQITTAPGVRLRGPQESDFDPQESDDERAGVKLRLHRSQITSAATVLKSHQKTNSVRKAS